MIAFSAYPPASDVGPARARSNDEARGFELAWSGLLDWLEVPLDTGNKHEQAYAPTIGIMPGKGGRKNAGPAGFVVFEFDDTATPEVLARTLERLQRFDALVYTSASATAENPRFRCVVRLSRSAVDDAEYSAVVNLAAQEVGAQPAPESFQKSRIWYRPIRGAQVWRLDGGEVLDVDHAIELFPRKKRGRPRKVDPVEVSKLPLDHRTAQAWQSLERIDPGQAFKAAAICRDYGVPEGQAVELVERYGASIGWTNFDGIEDRVANAYQYASGEVGNALRPPVEARPTTPISELRQAFATALAAAPATGPVALIAPMGLGKSHHARAQFEAATRALFVAPTIALARDIHARLADAKFYKHCHDGHGAKIVTTAMSLPRFPGPRDVVVLDEVVEIERQLMGGIAASNRRALVRALVDSMTTPTRCLLMGADLTRDDVARYEQVTGRAIHVIDFSSHTLMPRHVIETSPSRVLEAFEAAVREGKGRTAVFADSPRLLNQLALRAENCRRGIRIAISHGEERGDIPAITGPDADWELLLVSHSMASGVSIEAEVARVLVIRSPSMRGLVPPELVAQQIGRCRNYTGGPILVATPRWQPDTRCTDPATLLSEAWAASQHEGIPLREDPIDGVAAALFAAVVAKRDESHNNPYLGDACRRAGWRHDVDLERNDTADADAKVWRELEEGTYVEKVMASADNVEPRRANAYERNRSDLSDVLPDGAKPTEPQVKANRSNGRYTAALKACAHVLDPEGLGAVVGRREDADRDLTGRVAARTKAEARGAMYRHVFPGAPLGTDTIASASAVAAAVATLPFLRGRLAHVAAEPKADRGLDWIRAQLAAFGVTLEKDGDRLDIKWPTSEELAEYQRRQGLKKPRTGRGRKATLSARLAHLAVIEHGSQRRAAGALGVSRSTLQRALGRGQTGPEIETGPGE